MINPLMCVRFGPCDEEPARKTQEEKIRFIFSAEFAGWAANKAEPHVGVGVWM